MVQKQPANPTGVIVALILVGILSLGATAAFFYGVYRLIHG